MSDSRRTTLVLKLETDEMVILTHPDGTTIRLVRAAGHNRVAFDLPEHVKVHRAEIPNLFHLVPPEQTAAAAVNHGHASPRVVVPAPAPAPSPVQETAATPAPPPASAPPVTAACAYEACNRMAPAGRVFCDPCRERMPTSMLISLDQQPVIRPAIRSALVFLRQLDAMPRKSAAPAETVGVETADRVAAQEVA